MNYIRNYGIDDIKKNSSKKAEEIVYNKIESILEKEYKEIIKENEELKKYIKDPSEIEAEYKHDTYAKQLKRLIKNKKLKLPQDLKEKIEFSMNLAANAAFSYNLIDYHDLDQLYEKFVGGFLGMGLGAKKENRMKAYSVLRELNEDPDKFPVVLAMLKNIGEEKDINAYLEASKGMDSIEGRPVPESVSKPEPVEKPDPKPTPKPESKSKPESEPKPVAMSDAEAERIRKIDDLVRRFPESKTAELFSVMAKAEVLFDDEVLKGILGEKKFSEYEKECQKLRKKGEVVDTYMLDYDSKSNSFIIKNVPDFEKKDDERFEEIKETVIPGENEEEIKAVCEGIRGFIQSQMESRGVPGEPLKKEEAELEQYRKGIEISEQILGEREEPHEPEGEKMREELYDGYGKARKESRKIMDKQVREEIIDDKAAEDSQKILGLLVTTQTDLSGEEMQKICPDFKAEGKKQYEIGYDNDGFFIRDKFGIKKHRISDVSDEKVLVAVAEESMRRNDKGETDEKIAEDLGKAKEIIEMSKLPPSQKRAIKIFDLDPNVVKIQKEERETAKGSTKRRNPDKTAEITKIKNLIMNLEAQQEGLTDGRKRARLQDKINKLYDELDSLKPQEGSR